MPAGKTININQLLSKALIISKLRRAINAVVSPQPGQCTPKIVVHKQGRQISMPVKSFNKQENKKYPAIEKAIQFFFI